MGTSVYEAQERQMLFHNATADEVLYGGAAGGGKTVAILFDAVGKALSHKNLRIAVFRRTYPELEKSLVFNFLQKVPASWYKYHKNEKRATFNKTGSVIEFGHCQFESDVFKFQSAEYDFIYFDELTHWSEFMYTYLLSRLRTTKPDVKPQVKSATNPGGIGHFWTKSRFIDGAEPFKVTERMDPQSLGHYTTQFIPSRVYDNKYLMKDDRYIQTLLKLPEDERKALLEGDWTSFKGQFFKEWKNDLHVVEPFKIPPEWKRFCSMDFGYRAQSAILWYAVSPQKKVYVYRELYEVENTDEELVSKIKELSKGEQISYTIADPSLWSVTQYERGESIAYRFSMMGLPLVKADNNRMSGASTVHSYLSVDKDGKPSLMFFSTCFNSIRIIPGLVHDEKNPDEIKAGSEDHIYDSLRYGIMSHPIPKKKENAKAPAYSMDWVLAQIKEEKELRSYIGHQ